MALESRGIQKKLGEGLTFEGFFIIILTGGAAERV